MNTLTDQLRDIFIEVVNLHGEQPLDSTRVTGTADFYEDIGIDSLMAVALFVEIQRAYKVKLSEEQMPHLRSLEQIADHLLERAGNGSPE